MFSFYATFGILLKELMNQVEKVKIKLTSFEGEFRNTVTYHSRSNKSLAEVAQRNIVNRSIK